MTKSAPNDAVFEDLIQRVKSCTRCSRMADSARVIGRGCGPLDSKIVFVGEAPGRLGADESQLPFHGDKAGHNFEKLIEQVGISRYEAFVTNAVLCNPKDSKGNNSTPSPQEIQNCAPFLRETIELISPQIVVTLGAVALKACDALEPHGLSLSGNVRTIHQWMGRQLLPVYHPGQRAMIHRSFANQLSDYQFIAESLRRKKRSNPKSSRGPIHPSTIKLGAVARKVIGARPDGVGYFALHKLCFLAEEEYFEATGIRLTNSYVVRQKDGPYFVDLHISKIPSLVRDVEIIRKDRDVLLRLPTQLLLTDPQPYSTLSRDEIATIEETLVKHGQKTDADLKRAVYLSKPMRSILRSEKIDRRNMYNVAILPYLPRSTETVGE